MRLIPLRAALVAVAVVAPASAALYTPTLTAANVSASAVGWPSSGARTAAVEAAIAAPFAPNPASHVFRCALIDIGVSTDGQLRDPFGGYAIPMGSTLAAAVENLPYGSWLDVASTDLDGLLVRVLLELQASIGFSLEFMVAKPPMTLLPPLGSGSDAFIQWAFHSLNASCVLWPAPASPTRRLYFRQTVPLMTFGYSVVTTRPQFVLPTAADRVFLWTKPFSTGVWCLLMTAIVVYAILMPLFEGGESEDFSPVWNKRSVLVGHALYLGAMGPSKPDTFNPSSGGGRAAAALNAFAMVLIVSTYTANLAAQFATVDPAIQVVSDIDSFNSRVKACARSSTTLVTLLNSSFPNAAAALSPATTYGYAPAGTRDALEAVLAGRCEGAIVPATEAAWVLGVNDTRGEFCGLQVVGAPQGDEALPLTFSKASMTDAQLESINMAIEDLQRSGEFILDLQDALFPAGPRAVCGKEDSADAAALATLLPAKQVAVIDLAGAFMLQAIGLTFGSVIHCAKHWRRWMRKRRTSRASVSEAAAEEETDVEEKTRAQALEAMADAST